MGSHGGHPGSVAEKSVNNYERILW